MPYASRAPDRRGSVTVQLTERPSVYRAAPPRAQLRPTGSPEAPRALPGSEAGRGGKRGAVRTAERPSLDGVSSGSLGAMRAAVVRRRWRIGVLVSAVVLVTTAMTAAGRQGLAYVQRLDRSLGDLEQRAALLADSVRAYRVALDERTEYTVELQAVRAGRPRLPLMGSVVSGFSNARLHPTLKIWRPHRGIDIPARAGTPVFPVVAGRVVAVERELGFGLVVELQHGAVRTRYAHLRRAMVQRGDRVTPTTPIGEVGATGLATSPHLHYEILAGSRQVDPLRWALNQVEIVPTVVRRPVSAPSPGRSSGDD